MKELGIWPFVIVILIAFLIWLYFSTKQDEKNFKKSHPDNPGLPGQDENKVKEASKKPVKTLRCEKCKERYVYSTLNQTCPKIGCGGALKEEVEFVLSGTGSPGG